MGFIAQLTIIVYYVLAALVIVVIAGAAFFVFSKKKKKAFKESYHSADYAGLSRSDTKDYLKFDDIIDNVIITDNWRRFLGVIDCAGFDFYSMSAQEQLNVMKNYMPFINTIDQPITYRQYCSPADMEDATINYTEALRKVLAMISETCLQIDELTSQHSGDLSAEDIAAYDRRIAELSKNLDVYEFRRLHILDELAYIEEYSGNKVAPILTETYVFEWSADRLESADAMTKEQIFAKAKAELDAIAAAKIHALQASGVKPRRCSSEELIDMFRRHSLPVSSERFKKRDLRKADFDADIISSGSIEAYRKVVNEQKKSILAKQGSSLIGNAIAETVSLMSAEAGQGAAFADGIFIEKEGFR